ncbi:MAG TPA: ATP-binding cassette domain-containing protein [Luteolibacter sp.]|nr:ATP-binding cassette domain-containing protein [Luteolibacter sp.]
MTHADDTPAIELRDIGKSYDGGRSWAVRGFNLAVRRGEFVALLGGSGCGKTTTLKMINRLIDPDAGEIRVDGRDIAGTDPVALRRRIGYMFQGVGLFPHMTVAENVAITPRLVGWDGGRIARRVDELLDLVHLPPEEFRDRRPAELSGGQQQRVGFARSLAAEPAVILLDEAFGALDPITRDRLQEEFRQIHEQLGLTTVLVTHDMNEALLLADRIVVMRQGRIVQTGTPHELLADPADDYVVQLMDTPKRHAAHLESLIAGTP